MRSFFRSALVVCTLAAVTLSAGCQMFQSLHPNNTWKLNRGPAMDEGDAYFSVSDPDAEIARGE